ncbi:LPXTG-motif cell wall anchor domain protein [Brevibacterium mcbrellneri ATCC 49030]|uniref:LPXTG-motif cell wall anchor domain protein n=1 Tax=Brevibacterium mcbrellneri ATCC 49030 TaxID=585530 RepID=D4YJM7_9MICO|nr:G5 domain-containing protein [Brevibacterium mcbrellneri]EFG48618.1 LPXTG-motif cell wall anchor domain protein [Brevibacterium mcbrellneri ATCC 49030]
MHSSKTPTQRRRFLRVPIAALSALALTAGAFAVPNLMSGDSAAAATFSGGIRDKSGAVEKDDQRASDLPAGSCEVKGGSPSGSQAGFTWTTLEPDQHSTDKTKWGVSVALDNSKDRTFADWGFSNSGLLGGVLNTGTISSMDVGQTLLGAGGPVTAKADEKIKITSARNQRNLNLNSELTGEKVKQFADADASNPVRYAWQGKYTKDNVDGPKATRGDNVGFSATVNPWPSENDNCSPISVVWENKEKLVVKPGEELKVGTISADAASMPRMVIEAYDAQGKFIGTSNTEASGGEARLRVENSGDIYFTMPEYKGTELNAQQGVRFSVLALPRSVEQLQSVVDANSYEGKAFEESNALPRYSKANVIGNHQWSLDDTQFHDPKYDKTEAKIISGVESRTGPIATEPQKVTFKQVPDLIKNLAKKKGEGGFEAKVELDEAYVYEGWTVEMDDDYNVTVTAPENPRPGTFARPRITVEYSNGSTDILDLLVVVDPNNTQVTDLVKPNIAQGKPNQDIESQIKAKAIMKGHKAVAPAKYEVDESTVPSGWTVTVDKNGKVTAKADDSVPLGTVISPKVKATYPDHTTDEVEVQFQVINEIKVPTYGTEVKKPGEKASLKPTLPEKGLSGKESDEAPNRYTFEDGTTTFSKDGWTVTIDENTGELTTTVPKGAQPGDQLDIPVLAHYESGAKPQKATGTVFVIKGDEVPVYSVESTGPGKPVDHQVEDAPKGSKFSFGLDGDKPILEQDVDGWKYKVDPNTGVVTATPPQDAKPGDQKTVSVTVTAPDGSKPKVPVTTVVNLTNNYEAEPSYPTETVYPGDTAKLPVTLEKPDNVNVAKENPYKVDNVPAGWTVTVDDEGTITATAPADAKAGDEVKIPVTVTYEDGSKDTATAVVKVVDVPKREVPFKVEYKYDDSIPAGEYRTETKGEPGEEKQQKDGTWKRTKEPVNEVVVIGTKPAESAKEVTWTVPIPFPTEVRENPDLAPGETRVVQEGENGEKKFTAKFTAKGDKAEVVEEETTKEPVKRIVEYGPGLAPSELVTKTEKPVPFDTKVEFDPNLPAGEKVVDQKGELGTEVETSTQKLVDGKPSGDPTVTTERIKEPTTEKIRVGTKTEGTHTTSYEKDVPFETEIIFDENLEAGKQETVQEGKLGKDKVTTTQTIVNSKVTDTKTETERVTDPVKKIVKVGTKGKTTSKTVEWTENTPFEVEVRLSPELKAGETKVIQEGKPGEVKHTLTVTSDNGEISTKEDTEELSKPTTHIIEVGTAPTLTELTDKHTEKIPFETIIAEDPNLEAGKIVEDQAGAFGEKEITKTWKLKDGKAEGEPETSEKVVKEPQQRKLRVGTKCDCETPTPEPSEDPSDEPTDEPTADPTEDPTADPTEKPTVKPSETPSEEPTTEPSENPSEEPTTEPSETPTEEPTQDPTDEPSEQPSEEPTTEPSENPSEEPTPDPTEDPTTEPTTEPSETPTEEPSDNPSEEPSDEPTQEPSDKPSEAPTDEPSDKPSEQPSEEPSDEPGKPGDSPSDEPNDPGEPGQPGDDSDGPGTPGDSSKPGDSGKTGPLPRTGVEVAMAVAMGLGLIGAGIALTAASRRNRRS